MREPVVLTKVNKFRIPKYEWYSVRILLTASGGTLQCEVGSTNLLRVDIMSSYVVTIAKK